MLTAAGSIESRGSSAAARFVNSSLEAFEQSLGVLEPIWKRRSRQDEAAAAQDLVFLSAELARIDPQATEGADFWWALVLEQLQDGLL